MSTRARTDDILVELADAILIDAGYPKGKRALEETGEETSPPDRTESGVRDLRGAEADAVYRSMVERFKDSPDAHVGTVMSNFDRVTDEEVKAKLLDGAHHADHPAWDYHANVWYDPTTKEWYQAVNRFHELRAVFVGTDFDAVLTAPDAEFGTA